VLAWVASRHLSLAAGRIASEPIALKDRGAVMPEKQPVIVTGHGGLIGRAVCGALAASYAVIGLDRPGVPNPPPEAENVPCDLTSDESVADALGRIRQEHGERVASVIHLAAYYDFSGEPSPLYEQVTVRGTERLLRGLQAFAVEQFVFSSTMLVHAPCQPGQRINEDWPLEAKWDYPKSKLETERLILARRGQTPAVLLRIAGVYDDDCRSIPIAQQIQRIFERRLTANVFPGDTSTGQSFVHLDDLVDAFTRVVDRRRDLPPESTILIGEPDPLSYDELQRMLGWLLHGEEDWDTTRIPKAAAKAGAWVQDQVPGVEEPFIKPWMIDLADDHYALDITRARRLLDWEPRRTLRETLRRMVEKLKADPAAWYRANKLEGPAPARAKPATPSGKRAG
jgi:nucleoside-diphosphate-sugar epimerase